jgi:hypothetical protein
MALFLAWSHLFIYIVGRGRGLPKEDETPFSGGNQRKHIIFN